MAQSVEEQMNKILNEFQHDVDVDVEKETKSSARGTSKELKNVSPKDKGEYASGWTFKQIDKKTAVAYNRKQPGLTHLLERGHVIRNKKGEYGRAPAHVHIAPVESEFVQKFLQNIRRDIER